MASKMFIALLILPIVYVDSQTYSDADQLYSDVLNGYNKYVRPVSNQADILQVNVTYDIVNIQEINEVEGTISILFQFKYNWIDERIAWNPYVYNNTYSLALPIDAVWKPELILTNSAGPVLSLDSSMTMVKYYPHGLALWFPTGMISVSCAINVEYYPFDTQKCFLLFSVNNYFSTEMVLYSVNKEAALAYYLENGLWDIVKTEAVARNTGIPLFEVHLTLARRPAFIVIIVILPIMFLSILNILVFLLPTDSGERMSFTITLLLAQTVFMTIISDNIPHTSSPLSILCYFLVMQVLLSIIICVATLLNLRVYHKDETEAIPFWILRLLWIGNTKEVHPEVRSKSRIGWGNESDNLKSNTISNNGTEINEKTDKNSSEDWRYHKMPRNSNDASSSFSTEVSTGVTWKDISKSVDRILFIASLLYFVIVFVVFAFITGLREES